MNKTEALAVLHEIFESCRESVTINCVSIDPHSQVSKNPEGNYSIRMKCDLDSAARRCVASILQKHLLAMKEEKGFVIVYSEGTGSETK
jgi:hypothetical protein